MQFSARVELHEKCMTSIFGHPGALDFCTQSQQPCHFKHFTSQMVLVKNDPGSERF